MSDASNTAAIRLTIPGTCAAVALVFAMSGALLGLQAVPAAAAGGSGPCAVQTTPRGEEKPGGGLYPEAERVQAHVPGGEAEELEPVLGGQFGSAWFENGLGHARFYVGLTPGPMTIATATEAVDATLARKVSSGELPFIEAHTVVLEVPYSPAELSSAQSAIAAQLQSVLPAGSFTTGQTVGPRAGADRPGEWPLVVVELARRVGQAECETVEGLLAPFVGKVSLFHSESELEFIPAVGLSTPGGPMRPGTPPPPTQTARAPSSSPRSVWDAIGIHASARGHRLEVTLRIPDRRHGRLRVSVRLMRDGRLIRAMARIVRSRGRDSILSRSSSPRPGGDMGVNSRCGPPT